MARMNIKDAKPTGRKPGGPSAGVFKASKKPMPKNLPVSNGKPMEWRTGTNRRRMKPPTTMPTDKIGSAKPPVIKPIDGIGRSPRRRPATTQPVGDFVKQPRGTKPEGIKALAPGGGSMFGKRGGTPSTGTPSTGTFRRMKTGIVGGGPQGTMAPGPKRTYKMKGPK